MASYGQLKAEVAAWLNRRDLDPVMPGWVAMVETEIAETLRARCMVTSGTQSITSAYLAMPPDFATMESIRDNTTGELLDLKDEWSGHWSDTFNGSSQTNSGAPCTAYRLVHDCIEFLPHPFVPNPPPDNWNPQVVLMGWYQKPAPLLLNTDTNPVLEQLYGVYLFGVCKYGALFELDDDRAAQADAQWQQAVTRANNWKQFSDYSGAPFKSELATVF
jgi:hypothetical protein